MKFNFTATDDFFNSVTQINTLTTFAVQEEKINHEDNRLLFLKLSVVTLVTKFQVFIENVLKEFQYYIQTSDKINEQIPHHLRLNAIKIYTSNSGLNKKLENPETYNLEKLNEVTEIAQKTLTFCSGKAKINMDFKFEVKFPLGKTGVGELTKLFKQINGEDIFSLQKFDVEKLNEILFRRHAIIHEDNNPQLTVTTVTEYVEKICEVVEHIDKYLMKYK